MKAQRPSRMEEITSYRIRRKCARELNNEEPLEAGNSQLTWLVSFVYENSYMITRLYTFRAAAHQ